MIRKTFLLLPLFLGAQDVSIKLNENIPLTLEVTGRYKISYNQESAQTESRFAKKACVYEKNYQLIWGDETTASDEFVIEPLNGSRLLINGKQYSGSVRFEYGADVIQITDVDHLIQNVLQKPEFNHLSIETLKALSVVLRTDFSSEKEIFEASEFMYEGDALLYQFPKITSAIIETKDLVLKHQGEVFPTTYCADSAGTVASFDQIFRKKTLGPQGAKLPLSTIKIWAKDYMKKDLCHALNVTDLKNLSVYTDPESSKNYAVKITDSKGSKVMLIDRFMEVCDLKSNDFTLKTVGDKFVFEGKGEGLGVGLCLKTSELLSKEGKNFEAILRTCYPDTEISVLKK